MAVTHEALSADLFAALASTGTEASQKRGRDLFSDLTVRRKKEMDGQSLLAASLGYQALKKDNYFE